MPDASHAGLVLFDGIGMVATAVPAKLFVPTLPAYDGVTTRGVLLFDEGGIVNLSSGGKIPSISNYPSSGHAEIEAAFGIRRTESTGGMLWHNNTDGTCGLCNNMASTVLPEDAVLDVYPPTNAVAKGRGGMPPQEPTSATRAL